MEALSQYFEVQYPYTNLLEKRRANLLRSLAIFALILAGMVSVQLILTWRTAENIHPLLIVVPVLVVTAVAAMNLVNRGRLTMGAWVYIMASMFAALAIILISGLRSSSLVALAIPFFVSGLLLSRQDIILITVMADSGLVIIGLFEYLARQSVPDFWAAILPPVVLYSFFGLIQWLQVFEFHDSFQQIEASQQRLDMFLTVAENIKQDQPKPQKLQHFAQLVQSILDLQQVQIFLRDEDNPRMLQLRGAAGLAAQRALIEGRSVYLSADSLLVEAFEEREPKLVRTTDLANIRTDMLPGTNAQLFVPVMVDDEIIGVIDFQSAHLFAFQPEVIRIAQVLGKQLGLILRLHDTQEYNERARIEQEQLYAQLAQNSQELQTMRQQMSGIVWTRFFEDRGIEVVGFDKSSQDAEPTPSTNMTPTLAETLESANVEIVPVEGGYQLAIPITLRGQVLGAMEFFIPRSGELPERFVELANAISERLSMALDNARLVEQARNFAYREQQISQITGQLQTTNTIEDLLNMAAREFNDAMGSALTHIRLQLPDDAAAVPENSHSNGGGIA